MLTVSYAHRVTDATDEPFGRKSFCISLCKIYGYKNSIKKDARWIDNEGLCVSRRFPEVGVGYSRREQRFIHSNV